MYTPLDPVLRCGRLTLPARLYRSFMLQLEGPFSEGQQTQFGFAIGLRVCE